MVYMSVHERLEILNGDDHSLLLVYPLALFGVFLISYIQN